MSLFLEELRTSAASLLLTETIIEVSGPDATQFLNSQTSNNILNLKSGQFQLNLVLDLAGKINSSFILSKLDENNYILSVPSEQADECHARLAKFHISEDLVMVKKEQKTFLNINSMKDGILGQYFFDTDKITFDFPLEEEPCNLSPLSLLTGVPSLGSHQGELVNNTYFDDLAVDYNKGCFPGQETVAKVNTRRGAAYKPVLGIAKSRFETLALDGKKVGKIKECIKIGENFYHRIEILRNYRINKSNIAGMNIHYYPYIATTQLELAQEFYDEAMEQFKKNEYSSAIKYFEKAISLNKNFEDAYESLGVLHGRLENFESAIELMEQLKSINSKSMMAYTNLSLYHMKLGHIEKAEEYKSQATFLNFELLGDEAETKKKQAELAKKKETERDRREGMFRQVLEMDPADAMANNGMGEILLEKGEAEAGKQYFIQAIESDGKYSVAYLGLAKCIIQLNELSELGKVLEKGIMTAGKNGDLMPANEMQALKAKYLIRSPEP